MDYVEYLKLNGFKEVGTYMRKVIFKIDDIEWFRRFYEVPEEDFKKVFEGKESFKVIFTLYGNGKTVDRHELTDFNGNKKNINDLNGYEKGVILNDCYAYFEGRKYHSEARIPGGMIEVIEEIDGKQVKKWEMPEKFWTNKSTIL